MLMIDKGEVQGAIAAIKSKLDNGERNDESIADIRKLIDVKQSQIWRSEMGSCVGNMCNVSSLIDMEVAILERAITAIEGGEQGKAAALLDEYVGFIDQHYDNERTPY